ncbi:MAG: DUF6305 family protein, partial [Candidatus Aminicenantes bacterium]|nr:DUF6305 family protein [Candidatus Aminicenantes bacterium]
MTPKTRMLSIVLILMVTAGTVVLGASPQAELPKTEIPVLITSCGQSSGPNMIKVLFMRLKLQAEPPSYEMNTLATAEELRKAKEDGAPFKSIIIVMGASLKGMGAAGIDIEDEIERTSLLMQEARKQGITIIGAHITGLKNRAQGAAPGDNTDELSIDAVAPESDLLLINKEGNEDSRFTIISEEKNIPMIQVEKNLELL